MVLTDAQKTGLEAAILAYLTAEGGRFARTVAAFKEEAQVGGGDGDALVVSGAVMEKAWAFVHRGLDKPKDTKAFFDAIKSGDLAEVQLYVCVGIDVKTMRHKVKIPDGKKQDVTPLFWAAQNNRLEMVQFFLEIGFDKEPGALDDDFSPLGVAAQQGHSAVMRYLAERGADKDHCDSRGFGPMHMAAQNGHFEVVQYLVESGANKDKTSYHASPPLYFAAYYGHSEVLEYLVEQGADKEKVAGDDGQTPLMAACRHGDADMVKYMLDQGCDKDRADKKGLTALHHAAKHFQVGVAQVLLRYGAKLDARDKRGRTPAEIAVGHSDFTAAISAEEGRRRGY